MVAPYSTVDYSDDNGQGIAQLSGFGTIKFIEAVRDRPEVWDSRSNAYKQKDVKQQAWKYISAVMDPNFHNMGTTDQNMAVHGWMRRWKSLRDCYTREVGRLPGKKKKYIYFDHLTFLNDVIGSKRNSYHRMRERGEIDEEYTSDLYEGDLWTGKQEYLLVHPDDSKPEEILSMQEMAAAHRHHLDDDEPQPVAVFSITDEEDSPSHEDISDVALTTADCGVNTGEEDQDRMFLLSLVDDLKRVPGPNKLAVKTKILTVIQQAIDKN